MGQQIPAMRRRSGMAQTLCAEGRDLNRQELCFRILLQLSRRVFGPESYAELPPSLIFCVCVCFINEYT